MPAAPHAFRTLAAAAAVMLALAAPAAAQDGNATPFRPVAVVNDTVITAFDVTQRARVLRLLGFQAASVEALQEAALGGLIDDTIRLQAAARAGFAPGDEQFEAGLDGLAGSLQISTDEFRTIIANQGITESAMRDFLAPRSAWQSYVRGRFGGRINPSEAEIDREIALNAGIERVEVRLYEIGLPVGGGRSLEATLALAEQIRTDVTTDEAFQQAAREYSRTPSAEQGGEIGWMQATELPAPAREALAGLEPGDVTRPIQVPGGVTLIRLAERRRIGGEDVDINDPVLRESVREQLISDQANRLAEGLLQELKRDALIEQR